MSSFFTLPASQRKRKRTDGASAPGSKRRGVAGNGDPSKSTSRRNRERDESISGSGSDEDDEQEASAEASDESTSESEEETAADRRLRLAERYLENIREEVDETGFDAEEIDRDLIAQRLKEDVDEAKGRQYRQIASTLDFAKASHTFFRADTKSTTGVAVHEPYVYTVHKDTALIKWEIPQLPSSSSPLQTNGTSSKRKPRPLRRKPKQLLYTRGVRINASTPNASQGHTRPILSLAVSPSGTYLATGASDNRLIIWSAATLTPLKTFTTHRDSVTSLSFTPSLSTSSSPSALASLGGGEQLFSASTDRTIKSYSLSLPEPTSLAYVETLFGHQDSVLSVASMGPDTAVSVGGRDRTAHLWKVVDEARLVFRSGSGRSEYKEGSLDCVAALPPSHFITGADSGALELWNVGRKKAVFRVEVAHGVDPPPEVDEDEAGDGEMEVENGPVGKKKKRREDTRPTPRWITAMAVVPGTDVLLTGSWDGWVRAWRISGDKRSIEPLGPVGNAHPDSSHPHLADSNGDTPNGDTTVVATADSAHTNGTPSTPPLPSTTQREGNVHGIINSIAVFERRKSRKTASGEPGKGDSEGLCIVAGVGQEHRLGGWMRQRRGEGVRNGAVLFEVRIKTQEKQSLDEVGHANGKLNGGDEEGEWGGLGDS